MSPVDLFLGIRFLFARDCLDAPRPQPTSETEEGLLRVTVVELEKNSGRSIELISALCQLLECVLTGDTISEDTFPLAERTWELCQNTLGPKDPRTLTARFRMCQALAALGKYAEADAICMEVIDAHISQSRPDYPELEEHLSVRAWLLKAQGNYREAQVLYKEALVVLNRGSNSPSSIARVRVLRGLGECHNILHSPTDAELAFR
ncbi:hypothetical protein CYMTET_36178 [Cymbomonas tetramitiformis]|uniref:Tetratricopeptide repeat protein n=1 Tax=Cymbomonas tetramitiformis TaxID=36881 RepID=A0AAE0CHQ7_9CHLO|nr:hypothetical protein CYMTET_36178 [Cymbomonas tetramitiformis]